MTGPERAEAKTALAKLRQKFWDAGKVPPRKQFSKDQAKEWNCKIEDRMRELGIPKKDQGAGLRRIPPPGEKPPPAVGEHDRRFGIRTPATCMTIFMMTAARFVFPKRTNMLS
jgi:hypothetical protein